MKFSTRAEYGLRALSRLDKAGRRPVSLADIAAKEGLSLQYLERLFSKLKNAGLVRADLGSRGGYYLCKPAGRISLLEVLTALDDSFIPYACVTKAGRSACACDCTVNTVWKKIYFEMNNVFKQIKLSSVMK